MSNPKNKYYELSKNVELELVPAVKRSNDELHEVFKNMDGYKYINKHLIELSVNGEQKLIAIFRIVPEGDEGINYKKRYLKRVQISRKDVTKIPDYIVCAYINKWFNVFVRTTSLKSLNNLPKNSTTLFRVDIRNLQALIVNKNTNNNILKLSVKSRKFNTDLYLSTDINLIFNNYHITNKKFEINEEDFEILDISLDISQYDNNNQNLDNNLVPDPNVGRLTEKLAYDDLMNPNSDLYLNFTKYCNKIDSVIWVNKEKEQFLPYDFVINKNIYVEIKGSKYSSTFIMSQNEREFMLSKNTKQYYLIKFNYVNMERKMFDEFLIYTKKQLNLMKMNPMSFLVKEMEKQNEQDK